MDIESNKSFQEAFVKSILLLSKKLARRSKIEFVINAKLQKRQIAIMRLFQLCYFPKPVPT